MTRSFQPVHPIIGSIGHEDHGGKGIYMNEDGLTKREHFAGLAMQGVLAQGIRDKKAVAENAVRIADYLIDALNAPAKTARDRLHQRHTLRRLIDLIEQWQADDDKITGIDELLEIKEELTLLVGGAK